MEKGFLALAAAVLATPLLWDFAQAGQTTQAEAGMEAPYDPRARVQELRRERQEAREWITVPEMDSGTLLGLLREPGVAILDVTCKERGGAIPDRIPGAVWRDCTQVEQWAPEYRKDQTIVVYCA